MTTTLIFLAGILIGALFGSCLMAFLQGAARLGEEDLPPKMNMRTDLRKSPPPPSANYWPWPKED